MSYYFGDYTDKLEKDQEIAFYLGSIVMQGGEEVFTQFTEIEPGVFLFKSPLSVIREYYDDMKRYSIKFDLFNPFSDDTFYVIKEKDIRSVSALAKPYIDLYVDAVKKFSGMKVDTTNKKSKSLEWDDDELDSSVEENNSTEHQLDTTRTLH